MKGAHGESPRTAGRIEDSGLLDRRNQLLGLGFGARVIRLVRKESPQLRFGHDCHEMEDESLIHHVPYYVAGSVEGPKFLACNRFGVIVVRGKEVLEHLAQQFRIESNFLFEWRVLLDGELIAGKDFD